MEGLTSYTVTVSTEPGALPAISDVSGAADVIEHLMDVFTRSMPGWSPSVTVGQDGSLGVTVTVDAHDGPAAVSVARAAAEWVLRERCGTAVWWSGAVVEPA